MITLLEFSGKDLCLYLLRKNSQDIYLHKMFENYTVSYFSTTKCGQNILLPVILPLKLVGNK